MQHITKSSLEKFQCNITTELPVGITAILNLANEPSFPYTTAIWNEFVDYSATECICENYYIFSYILPLILNLLYKKNIYKTSDY